MKFKDRLIAFERMLQSRMKEFKCPVHLCLGQEDVPAALFNVLRKDDWLFSTHRNHGHYLAKCGSERALLQEILGEPDGVNAGWAGSQCFSDPSINFHATAMVGGLIGVAVGTALALKRNGSEAVVVCCIGDGATEEGVFWESLNAAHLWSLPVLFVIENNGYSVHAPIDERQGTPLYDRICAFGIRNYITTASNCNVFITAAYGWAKTKGPACVEVACVRECNHVGNMPDFRSGARP